MKRIAIGAALLFAAATADAAPSQPFTSVYSRDSHCDRIAQGRDGEDWVAYRCSGLPGWPLWLLFQDSARMQIGFGPRRNHAGTFQIGRAHV